MKRRKETFTQRIPFSLAIVLLLSGSSSELTAQNVPPEVQRIFTNACIVCHSGKNAPRGMDLSSSKSIFATAVAHLSSEKDMPIISPGNPEKSYLMMKIRHDPSIAGNPMPLNANKLSPEDIGGISTWIASLSGTTGGMDSGQDQTADRVFDGWVVGNTPTAELPRKNQFLFFVGHRFIPKTREGYDLFYGLNGPATMLFSLGYSFIDNVFVSLGRSNANNLVELRSRFRVFQDTRCLIPVSVAVQNDLYWNSTKFPGKHRLRGEALAYTLQIITTGKICENWALALAPGLIVNPDMQKTDENPVVFLGIGGAWHLGRGLSFIADYVPVLSGKRTRSLYGLYTSRNRYDSLTIGLEKRIGGHDFQVLVTNSEGIAAPQYATGGDLNFGKGNMRLGFNIFRLLGN